MRVQIINSDMIHYYMPHFQNVTLFRLYEWHHSFNTNGCVTLSGVESTIADVSLIFNGFFQAR